MLYGASACLFFLRFPKEEQMNDATTLDAEMDDVDSDRTRDQVIFFDPSGMPTRLPKGTPIEWRVCCYAFIRRSDGRILFVIPRWRDQDLLELPGGGMIVNESMEMCLEREVFEETGLTVRMASQHPLYVGEANIFIPRKRKFFHVVYLVFSCEIEEGQDPYGTLSFTDTEEIRELRWARIGDLSHEAVHQMHHKLFKVLFPLTKE